MNSALITAVGLWKVAIGVAVFLGVVAVTLMIIVGLFLLYKNYKSNKAKKQI